MRPQAVAAPAQQVLVAVGLQDTLIEQDRTILESQRREESRLAEHLANSDRGVTELRKLLREKIACRTAS